MSKPIRKPTRATQKKDPPNGGHWVTCAHCGQRFEAFRPWTKYCSVNCRVTAWQRRKREEGDGP